MLGWFRLLPRLSQLISPFYQRETNLRKYNVDTGNYKWLLKIKGVEKYSYET